MSAAFKVGDRVRWHIGESRGVVTAIGNVTGMVRVRWDSEAHGEGHYQEQALLRSVEPTTVGDLVHPSGAKVEAGPAFQIASSGGAGYYTGLGDYIGVTGTLRAASSWTSPNLDDLRREMAELMRAGTGVLAARDEHRAMRAALDTVRKFLGEASFASCSLADQRRAREVMGVVLRAIDAGKAGK